MPICTPIVPSAHASEHPKQHLDWFSYFCRAHHFTQPQNLILYYEVQWMIPEVVVHRTSSHDKQQDGTLLVLIIHPPLLCTDYPIVFTICTSFQTLDRYDTHTSSLNFAQAKCSSRCPTNSVKALKAANQKNFCINHLRIKKGTGNTRLTLKRDIN